MRLTAEDGYQASRSYSIASAPEHDAVELTIERFEDGEVSPYLVDDVITGDQIERLRRRCGSARDGPLAVEHLHLAVASPLRFGRRSIQSRPQPITAPARRELSYEHERKQDG